MDADEIRMTFGHNSVYGYPNQQASEWHNYAPLLCLAILAVGELAAQIAESNKKEG